MWIIVFLVFGPFIYLIVSPIVDSISNNVKQKYYGEENLFYVTTYQNDNITEDDIMRLFNSQIEKYTQRYFNINYKLFDAKEEQNYAWSIKTTKQTFGWGIVYNIKFLFSNGLVYLSFSNSNFSSGGKPSKEYYFLGSFDSSIMIERELDFCWEESRIKWKMNGREPENDLPFNFYSLITDLTGKQKKFDSSKSSDKNSSTGDLLSFYRNLLGLKLRFSQTELKNAYREATRKYHPDRYGASSSRDRDNAEMLMKQVNDAYEKLKEIAG
jgi:hypothetical protein